MRILHCPNLVGGQATSLSRQERAQGESSLAVSWLESSFGYPVDEILWEKNASLLSQEKARWQLYRRALGDFDVIHYNFGSPMLNWGRLDGGHRSLAFGLGGGYAWLNQQIELALLKMKGKVVAVTYQGDDARQGDYCRKNFEICIANEVDAQYYSDDTDAAKRDRIERFGRHADLIYALNPDLLHVLPANASFLPYAHVDLDLWQPIYASNCSRPLVVHAPSHLGAKGTRFILAAVENLKNRGVDFDFELVTGLTQSEARKVYERADLVVDQLLAGWYGGFAVEVMALGKPVICYLRHEDFGFLPEQMRTQLPIIDATPASIETVLLEWIKRPHFDRASRGALGRQYVEKWHNPKTTASRLLTDYRNVLNQGKR